MLQLFLICSKGCHILPRRWSKWWAKAVTDVFHFQFRGRVVFICSFGYKRLIPWKYEKSLRIEHLSGLYKFAQSFSFASFPHVRFFCSHSSLRLLLFFFFSSSRLLAQPQEGNKHPQLRRNDEREITQIRQKFLLSARDSKRQAKALSQKYSDHSVNRWDAHCLGIHAFWHIFGFYFHAESFV